MNDREVKKKLTGIVVEMLHLQYLPPVENREPKIELKIEL